MTSRERRFLFRFFRCNANRRFSAGWSVAAAAAADVEHQNTKKIIRCTQQKILCRKRHKLRNAWSIYVTLWYCILGDRVRSLSFLYTIHMHTYNSFFACLFRHPVFFFAAPMLIFFSFTVTITAFVLFHCRHTIIVLYWRFCPQGHKTDFPCKLHITLCCCLEYNKKMRKKMYWMFVNTPVLCIS